MTLTRLERWESLEELDRLVEDDRLINAPPYLARAADVQRIRRAFFARELTLGDFYQDWSGWSPVSRYSQFISLPVPVLGQISKLSVCNEYGVFNIDSFEQDPLYDEATKVSLAQASGCS